MPLFWLCAKNCKERITVKKEEQTSAKDSLKYVLKDRNGMAVIAYTTFNMIGMMGRIGCATYFYIYVVQNFALITVFMMMPMFVGAIVMPFGPKVINKIGRKKTLYVALILEAAGCLMMFFGPYTNIPYLLVAHVIYGMGYIGGACGMSMLVDVITDIHSRTGARPDGTLIAMNSLAGKIGQAIGSALGIAIIGWFGYVAGKDITSEVRNGIQIAVNLMPAIVYILALIPVAMYKLED